MIDSELSTLTTMLQRAGLLGESDVAKVRAHCAEHRVSPAVALTEMSLLSEEQLVRFLRSKLVVPAVDASLLAKLPTETARYLPTDLAWRYVCLPVSLDDAGNMTLAMADPTDLQAVESVTEHTQRYLIRAVAPISVLRQAITTHLGPPPAVPITIPGDIDDMTPAYGHESGLSVHSMAANAISDGPTITEFSIDQHDSPMSQARLEQILPLLEAASTRDQLLAALLDYLHEAFERVILFSNAHSQLRGRDARGDDLVAEAVAQVRIPALGPSVFSDVIARQEPWFLTWPTQRPIDRAFANAMGGILGQVLVLPITLGPKTPLLIFAMAARVIPEPEVLDRLTTAMSQALERLIRQRKQG